MIDEVVVWFGLVTLFPEIGFALQTGLIGKAIEKKLISIATYNPRDYTLDKHRTVDDKAYGGGPGMVMMAPPLKAALQAAKASAPSKPYTVYLSPQGKLFTQAMAEEFAQQPALLFLAGRYEGIDERIIEREVDAEWSIGDYILTGGEFPALVIIDTITRLLPGVIGDQASIQEDSLTRGLLKFPQYTRPETFEDNTVPPVLLSGHHEQIERWRKKQSLGRTWLKRPDILDQYSISKEEKALLLEFMKEHNKDKT